MLWEPHPFNIYCPNVRDPPVIPGNVGLAGLPLGKYANDCQYVAIKDNIGYVRTADLWITATWTVLREKQTVSSQ